MVAQPGPDMNPGTLATVDLPRAGRRDTGSRPALAGRRLYIPRMTDCGAKAFAAALRSAGIDAVVLPPSDDRTLELGSRHLSGEECLPAKVTLGDFLKVAEAPGFDPGTTAFMMPTSQGPCRLGQYTPAMRRIFRGLGYPEVLMVSLGDSDGYQGVSAWNPDMARTGWRALVASDILRKLLLKTRPYELVAGDADTAYRVSLGEICATLEVPGRRLRDHLADLLATLTRIRGRFRAIPARYERGKLLIGIQGEMFCRMEEFSNDHLIRHLEALGAEAWFSDLSEWIWYCNWDQEHLLRLEGRRFSFAMLRAVLRDRIQRTDERVLWTPFAEDFLGYEEPEDTEEILQAADAYLPRTATAGEMVLSAGKVECFFRQGVDGIIDISPFSCMNGIVSEALYPRQSQDCAGLPIRNFYFDGKGADTGSQLEIFLELARAYQHRKPHRRRYPSCFA